MEHSLALMAEEPEDLLFVPYHTRVCLKDTCVHTHIQQRIEHGSESYTSPHHLREECCGVVCMHAVSHRIKKCVCHTKGNVRTYVCVYSVRTLHTFGEISEVKNVV